MKILILSDDFPPHNLGGAGVIAFNLARAFQKRGHSLLIITTVQDRNMEGAVEYEGLKIHRIYSNYHERWRAYLSLYNPQTVKKVKKIITEFKPDIVHVHNIHSHLSYRCLKIAKQSSAKVFLTAHDVMIFHYGKLIEYINPKDLSCPTKFNYKISPWQQIKRFKKRYNPFRNIIIKHYLKYVDKIFAVSNALKDALNQNGIRNVEVIHNGIDVQEWQIEGGKVREFKEKYNLIGKKVILFGGRLSEAKGGYQAILALGEVVKKIPEAVLLIMGDKNEYAKEMMRVAKERGIDNHLVFTGWISGDELKAVYSTSDLVCVLSTYLDPFPTINLEAMANKKPVIGTCLGGTSEVVANGTVGYIINPHNINDITKKIAELLSDTTKANKFGVVGYQTTKEEFNLEKSANKYLDKFTKIS